MPSGMFFNITVMYLLTTPTIDRLRALHQTPASKFGASPRHRVDGRRRLPALRESEWIGRSVGIGGDVRLAIIEPCPRRGDPVTFTRAGQARVTPAVQRGCVAGPGKLTSRRRRATPSGHIMPG